MCIHCSHRLNYGSFCPIKPRKSRKKPPKTSDVVCESDEDDCDEMNEGDTKPSSPKLFARPNEGCIRVYRRYGLMGNHVAYGKCKFQPERDSLIDTAKIKYSKKLWDGEISIKTGITGSAATVVPLADSQTKEEEGWALRTTKKAKAFSEKQKKFLEERFMVGETTGRKLDPVTVARQMKIARDVDGQRRFCLPRRFKASFHGGKNAKTQRLSQFPTKIMKELKMKKSWQSYEMSY